MSSSSNSLSPHDAVFRRVLGVPSNAASQLRAVLPPALLGRLDLDKLTPVPGSLVDSSLRRRHTDLLFTAPLDGREAFVYVLVEHQSGSDPLMAFRMLRYVVRIWDRYLADHPRATRLPAVVPLVVHHADRPWHSPVQLLDLVDLKPDLAKALDEFLPRFRFLLDDLVRVDERALRERPLTPPALLTLLLLKVAPGNAQLAEDLRGWTDELRAVRYGPDGKSLFEALLRYIELVTETDDDQLFDLVAGLGPEAKESYVTLAEMREAKGRAEGMEKGLEKGLVAGRAETLVEQLTFKFGPLPEGVLATVRAATADQLRSWTARVLTADTLDQLRLS